VQAIVTEGGHEVFEVEAPSTGTVILHCSSGVAVATGLNWYLKHCCNRQLSWCGNRIDLQPGDLRPVTGGHRHAEFPRRQVVYMNYRTLSYNMAWWGWKRWQREIDSMAMNGVSMPRGMVDLEAVWYQALLRIGLSEEEARTFCCPKTPPVMWSSPTSRAPAHWRSIVWS
jgi:alpha-N-acetylglucosaminidase